MPPNESLRIGKTAILLGFRKTRDLNDEYIDRSTIDDVRVSGDLAVARGMTRAPALLELGVGRLAIA